LADHGKEMARARKEGKKVIKEKKGGRAASRAAVQKKGSRPGVAVEGKGGTARESVGKGEKKGGCKQRRRTFPQLPQYNARESDTQKKKALLRLRGKIMDLPPPAGKRGPKWTWEEDCQKKKSIGRNLLILGGEKPRPLCWAEGLDDKGA